MKRRCKQWFDILPHREHVSTTIVWVGNDPLIPHIIQNIDELHDSVTQVTVIAWSRKTLFFVLAVNIISTIWRFVKTQPFVLNDPAFQESTFEIISSIVVALNWKHHSFQIHVWRIAGLNNDVKFAIKNVIREFVAVEHDERVKIGDHVDELMIEQIDVRELRQAVEKVVIDDERHEHDEIRFDWIDETVEMVVHFMHRDDEVVDDEVVDDEEHETVEMVDVDDTPTNKQIEHNDETVEIPECIERGELDEPVDPFIRDEHVDKRENDEIDISGENDEIDDHVEHRERDDVGWSNDDVDEIHDEINDETVDVDETQSRTFIDSIWTQGIFGINASMRDDEKVVIDETDHEVRATHGLLIDDHDETVQMVDKSLCLTIACTNNDVSMFVVVNDDLVGGHTRANDHEFHVRQGKQAEVFEPIDEWYSEPSTILTSQISILKMIRTMNQYW